MDSRQERFQGPARAMEELEKDRRAISRLAQSGEARELMQLLSRQEGQVRQAAQAAAAGSPEELMAMVERLMNSKEGAELVRRIGDQARQAGIE